MDQIEFDAKEALIIKYLIDKKELRIPLKFLRSKSITELEKALSSGVALFVSGQYKKMFANVDDYFDLDEIEELCNMVEDIEGLSIEKGFNANISDDDQKIINFLAGTEKSDIVDFLEMAGPYYFFLEVAQEWSKSHDKTPELIKVVLIMWLFVNTYEILLHQVDRNILHYLTNNKTIKKTGNINLFINNVRRKEFKDHATAEKINKVLCDILSMNKKNNSIFGMSSKPKVIRNKISHSNMYYDSDTKKVVLLSGKEYDIKEFITQYFVVFSFMTSWLRKHSTLSNKDYMRREIKVLLKALSNKFLQIERGKKRQYAEFIVNIKKEIMEKKDNKKASEFSEQ